MLKNFEKIIGGNYADIKITTNYHAHNYMCRHAVGTVEDYVAEAVKLGYESIGVSDHFVSPYNKETPYITQESLISEYLPQFAAAKNKYGNSIKIYSAVEVEYYKDWKEIYKNLLDNLDYLVLGQHDYLNGKERRNSFGDSPAKEDDVISYCRQVTEGINSGFFKIVAHPDIIFYNGAEITPKGAQAFENIVRTAAETGTALEFNANGIRHHHFYYPTDLLVDLCLKYDAGVVISSDNHAPAQLGDDSTKKLYAYARACGLNLIDPISVTK